MGVVVGVILFLIVLGAFFSLIERGTTSRLMRPYIGLLLIAALIAALGGVLGFLFRDLQGFFLIIAKVVAVFACVSLCIHLIFVIAKRWL